MKGFNIIKLLKEYSTKSDILFAFRLLHNFRWESILNRMKNSGFLFIDKEEGVSSRRVDNLLRKKRGEKHVGHLGTLDPFASGLLIVAIGEATKRLPYLSDDRKTYVATLVLGKETDTLDLTGKVIKEKEVPALTKEKILKAMENRTKTYDQEIPSFSATHYNGKRRYDLAREGVEIPMLKKTVSVYQRNLLQFDSSSIVFSAEVSKGTYIRSLGKDLALELDTLGYLSKLRRTHIGKFSVEDALPLDKISNGNILPMDKVLEDIDSYEVTNANDIKRARHGNELNLPLASPLLFIKDNQTILALYKKEGNRYVCVKGFNQ